MMSGRTSGSGIGAGVRRLEDPRLLTGAGHFTGDDVDAGALHAAFVRSPHAHARIVRVDAEAARAAPGVVAIFTGADLMHAGVGPLPFAPVLARRDGAPVSAPPRRALAADIVRHAGEAVAIVVAATAADAAAAAELVDVEWEPLDAVVGVDAACTSDAVRVNGEAPDNVCAFYEIGDAAVVDAAFRVAAHVAALDIVNNRLIANALEPRAALATWDCGRLTLRVGCQMPHLAQRHLCQVFPDLKPHQIRVQVPDIGGGFGAKSFLYPEYVAVAFAARALGCTVLWVATRSESFLADCHGRDQSSRAELALAEDGRFLALRVRTRANVGAYLSYLGAVIPTIGGTKPLSGVYRIPAIRLEVEAVLTHTAPVEAYRGAGRPEVIFLLERLIDHAARATGMDAVALRRRNLIAKSDMPYRTAMGETYDSGDFARLLDRALRISDWAGFAERQRLARARGRLAGRGLACFIESTGAANPVESARIVVGADAVTVLSGTQEMGQGLATAYAQIVTDRLGVPIDCVRIVQGDTDIVPRGGGSGGSRSLFIGGSAVLAACNALIERHQKRPDFAGGIDWLALARSAGAPLTADGLVKLDAFSWPNGCQVCEVEVEPDTGFVTLTRFFAVDDVGVVVNPMIVDGQTHGAIVQGLGQALLEHIHYDADSGQLLTGSFMDYAMPRAHDVPRLVVETDETSPCLTNPLGAKGAGEGGTIGAPPAIVNAVVDALADLGVEHIDMPLTPERIWRAIRNARRLA